jgi:hypothetical protein
VSGTSAGGLATYYHAAYVKSLLKAPGARLVAAPDAGFFMNHLSLDGVPAWRDNLLQGVALWNGTLRGAGASCLQDRNATEQVGGPVVGSCSGWRCLRYHIARFNVCYMRVLC